MTDFLQESNAALVREFHLAFNTPVDQAIIKGSLLRLRLALISEESKEFLEAIENYTVYPDFPIENVAKELADLLYVLYGFAVTYGIDIDEVFYQVHKSNMSKLGDDGKPVYREDGKIMKGPNYKPPQLEFIFK